MGGGSLTSSEGLEWVSRWWGWTEYFAKKGGKSQKTEKNWSEDNDKEGI